MKIGYCLAVALTLAVTGLAQAQSQVCIHQTADGRCLHWVNGSANSSTSGSSSSSSTSSSSSSSGRYQSTPPPVRNAGCMVNPATGESQQCVHISADGRCLHFGDDCD